MILRPFSSMAVALTAGLTATAMFVASLASAPLLPTLDAQPDATAETPESAWRQFDQRRQQTLATPRNPAAWDAFGDSASRYAVRFPTADPARTRTAIESAITAYLRIGSADKLSLVMSRFVTLDGLTPDFKAHLQRTQRMVNEWRQVILRHRDAERSGFRQPEALRALATAASEFIANYHANLPEQTMTAVAWLIRARHRLDDAAAIDSAFALWAAHANVNAHWRARFSAVLAADQAFRGVMAKLSALQTAPFDTAAMLDLGDAAAEFVAAHHAGLAEHTAQAIQLAVHAYRAANADETLVKVLDRWITLPDFSPDARALVQLMRAEGDLRSRELTLADAVASRALDDFETEAYRAPLARVKAEALIQLGRLGEAERFIAEMLAAEGFNWAVVAALKTVSAQIKLRAKHYDAAILLCREVETLLRQRLRESAGDEPRLQASMGLATALTLRGHALLRAGKPAEARNVANELRAQLGPGAAAELDALIALPPGSPAPEFVLRDYRGNRHTAADWNGRYVLVHFWSSACPFSRELMRTTLRSLAADFSDFTVVSVAHAFFPSDTTHHQRDFIDQAGIHWPTLHDDDGTVATAFGAPASPYFVLLDADGTIVTAGCNLSTLDDVRHYLARR